MTRLYTWLTRREGVEGYEASHQPLVSPPQPGAHDPGVQPQQSGTGDCPVCKCWCHSCQRLPSHHGHSPQDCLP